METVYISKFPHCSDITVLEEARKHLMQLRLFNHGLVQSGNLEVRKLAKFVVVSSVIFLER